MLLGCIEKLFFYRSVNKDETKKMLDKLPSWMQVGVYLHKVSFRYFSSILSYWHLIHHQIQLKLHGLPQGT